MAKQKRRPTTRSTAVKRTTIHKRSSTSRSRAKQAVIAKRGFGKRFLLHPTTMFGLLVMGVFLAGLTFRVIADTLSVTAVVPAPALSSGATITSPTTGQIITSRPIVVVGSCSPESYVKLYRNGMFSGSAVCINTTFQIQTSLFVGANDLKAQAYNVTDQAGPSTPEVRVVYQPPAAANTSTTEYTPPNSPDDTTTDLASAPLLLWSDYHFSVFDTSSEFAWGMQFQSGNAPYDTHIDWGDGQKSHVIVPTTETFTISHHYSHTGYYPIIVDGTDANGREVSLQLTALIKKPGAAGTVSSITNTPAATGAVKQNSFKKWLAVAWPSYTVVGLMASSFWLGERREFLQLLQHFSHGKK